MKSVGVVMGSASDAAVMEGAIEALREFGVPVEVRVLSAHRTPDDALQFARDAAGRGFGVLIAGAGKAAHLAGVLAAVTSLPVIGVPIASGDLGGLDALLAMVQMPPGVPVATVAVERRPQCRAPRRTDAGALRRRAVRRLREVPRRHGGEGAGR